jgi:hypothetical protein
MENKKRVSATTVSTRSLPLSSPLPGGTGLSAPILSRTRPFSLAARWDHSISADRPFARSPLLARGPHLLATSPSLTSHPRSQPWTRPRHVFPGHSPMRLTPFLEPAPTHSLPLLSCALNRPPRTSLSQCTCTRGAPLWSVVRFVAAVELLSRPLPRWAPPSRQQRETPSGLPPTPLILPVPAHRALTVQPELPRHWPKASLRPRRCSSAPESPLEVSKLPTPLISHLLSHCKRNRSSKSMCTTIGLLRRGPRPLVPLCRFRAHGWVRCVTPNSPRPFPHALDPRCGRALACSETSPWRWEVPPWAGQ